MILGLNAIINDSHNYYAQIYYKETELQNVKM